MQRKGLGLVVALAAALPAAAQDLPVKVELIGGTSIGSQVQVEIHLLEAGHSFIAAQLDLEYDPAVLQAAPTPWVLGPDFQEDFSNFLNEAQIPPTSPFPRVQLVTLDLAADAGGRPAGLFARARFTVVGSGTFAFKFTDTEVGAIPVFIDNSNNLVPVALEPMPVFSNVQPGVTVWPTSGLVTSEAGGSATFSLILTSAPTADVTVTLSSSNPAEGAPSAASVTFTPATWNTAKIITVTGANDGSVDPDHAYGIVVGAAVSDDADFNGFNAPDVSLTNSDNDAAAVLVSTSGYALRTTEAGTSVTFGVVLAVAPTADVTIPLSTSSPGEATVSPESLLFTTSDWSTPQIVTITGVDDSVDDGEGAYWIVFAAAGSGDPAYDGLNAANLSSSNADNDTAGVSAGPTEFTMIAEGGSFAVTVVLQSKPTAIVTIPVSCEPSSAITPSTTLLTFTPANWNQSQDVIFSGVQNPVDEADDETPFTASVGPLTSSDPLYNRPGADVIGVVTDDDVAGITVTAPSVLATTEAGTAATFTVVLDTQPSADVTIAVSSSMVSEGTVSPAALVFTAADWNVAREVTVTGVNDAALDLDAAYTVVLGQATGADPVYSAMNPADLAALNASIDTDLKVSVGGSWPSGTPGSVMTFTVLVRNHGPAAASGVEITAPVPGPCTILSIAASRGSYDAPGGLWTVGALAVDAQATLTFEFTPQPESVGNGITASAAITGGLENDHVTSDNQDSDEVTVDAPGEPKEKCGASSPGGAAWLAALVTLGAVSSLRRRA